MNHMTAANRQTYVTLTTSKYVGLDKYLHARHLGPGVIQLRGLRLTL